MPVTYEVRDGAHKYNHLEYVEFLEMICRLSLNLEGHTNLLSVG